jgi:NAD(P)-dependent dehydrogenase (short-subunit alcohol dehydrogenase family)
VALLDGKTVIVSGVGPGLGQAMARIAAGEGARVILAARNRDYLDKVRQIIVAAGGEAIAAPCDVADTVQCRALAEIAAAAFGGQIHGLINSAYFHGEWSGVADADPGDFARAFDVNCLGALRLAQACVPYMKGGGAVVNVSTMATVRPFGTEYGMEMGYATSKAALNTLGKYMAADLGRHGIRVNTCRMGWIHGAPVRSHIADQVDAGADEAALVASITRDIPIGVIPPEDDCARAVMMLLSDHARVVTGATLDINGGPWMAP